MIIHPYSKLNTQKYFIAFRRFITDTNKGGIHMLSSTDEERIIENNKQIQRLLEENERILQKSGRTEGRGHCND